MGDNPKTPETQAPSIAAPIAVVFDAPETLNYAFITAGWHRHGRQPGAWHRRFTAAEAEDARDQEYELKGVGPTMKWWQPPDSPRSKP